MERLLAAQRRAFRTLRSDEAGDSPHQGAETWVEAVAAEEELAGDPEEMDYDELLELGERLGDVRREMWRARSAQVIASIPALKFAVVRSATRDPGATTEARLARYTETLCVVCQFEFADDDDVKLMPHCTHLFHAECVDAWLRDNETCVTCKRSVVSGGGIGDGDGDDDGASPS